MRNIFLALGITLLAATGIGAEQPNVLFIISDDLSAEALGSYGNDRVNTPNLDRLAAQGVRFTRAYSQYPVCGPSRAALMSGMYPSMIGVMNNGQASRLGDEMGERPTMTQHFLNQGYYTARVSKIYHMRVPGDITAGVDGPDHTASWSERFNCPGQEWMTPGSWEHLSNETLNRAPDKHYGLGFGTAFYTVRAEMGEGQPDVQAADKAIALLNAHKEGPFFLAVGMVRPHVPLVAPDSYFDAHPAEGLELPPKIAGDWEDIPEAGISANSKGMGLEGALDKQRKVLSAYYASVSFMDAQAGRIIAELDRLGLREQTIVVFTSDHGYHLGEHDFWQKMSLHDESVRIPLIIDAPGIRPAVTDALAQQIDLFPTLSALAGFAVPPHCQGKSLVPVLDDPGIEVHQEVYAVTGRGQLVRSQRWAYMRYNNNSSELYDMEQDRRQYENLAGDGRYAEVRAGLDKKLANFRESVRIE